MSGIVSAAVDLNQPGIYLHWGWFQMSLANFLVIVTMVVVFVLAIVLPFPRGRRS
jgi:large-conductance mechanosensitive channel